MKLLFIMSAIVCAQFALADSFTVIRDGKEYLCEQRSPVDPGASEICVTKAYNAPFSHDESIELCAGARSVAPADCAIKAYNGPYSKEEAIRMCKEQPLLVLRSLVLIEQAQELKPKIEAMKRKIKD